jgi:PST family polysaccharide transporter
MARLLTPEAFGVVAIAQTILSFAEVLQQMGLGSALVQTDRLSRKMERSAVSLVLFSSTILIGIIYVSRDMLSDWFQTPELSSIMPIMLATFLLTAANNPSIMLLNREMRFRALAVMQLGTYLIGYGAVAIVLAYLGYSYWSLVWASFVQAVLYFVAVHWLRPVWPTLKPDWGDLKPLLNFGGGMLLSQIFNNIARRGDNLVIAATLGTAPLGHYSRAYGLMDLGNQLFGTVLYKVLFPAFSEKRRAGIGDAGRLSAFLLSHLYVAILVSPAAALAVLLAPEIVGVLLGPQWFLAGEVLRVLGAAMYFRLAYKVSGAFTAAEGAVYWGAAIQSVYAGLAVLGAWIGARYGLVEVAVGVTIALLVQHLMLAGLATKVCGSTWRQFASATLPPVCASVVAAIPVFFLHGSLVAAGAGTAATIAGVTVAYLLLYGLLIVLIFRFFPSRLVRGNIAQFTIQKFRQGLKS